MYNFDKIADRSHDHSRKWCPKFVEKEYGKVPEDYIAMSIADMDYEIAPPIYNKFKEIIEEKTFGYIYAYDEFLEAVKYWTEAKINRTIDLESILPFNGVVPSLNLICNTFAKENDSIIILSPVYGPFRKVASNNHLNILESNLILNEEGRYEIDFTDFEAQIKENQPKIFIMCNPQNPSGRVWTSEEMNHLAEICYKNHVLFVSDEVHSDHIYKGTFNSALSLEDKYMTNTIVACGPNKGFNFAGLCTSYVIIPDHKLREQLNHAMECDCIALPNMMGMAAICAAYTEEGKHWLEASYQYITEGYEWAQNYVSESMPKIQSMPIDASYLMWLNVSRLGVDGDEFTQKLAHEQGVLVQSGSIFGEAGKDYIRINIGTSKELVQEAFHRINNLYNELINKK